jgi:uncharacterized caspase-like protein
VYNQNIYTTILKDSEATRDNFLKEINRLSDIISPTDEFIFYTASHGVLYKGLYSIVMYDYDGTLSENSFISSNEIMEMSKKIKALNQLLILDTCHAGGFDNFLSGLYDARMTILAKNMGIHMYASASEMEGAIDGYRGNGLFTYTLLEGLNNNKDADINLDKKVSVGELGLYAKENTVRISRRVGYEQNPLIINFGRDNILYIIR